ncbi:iron chaperone [Cellulomonas gilvus]|uniref:YdhG-like domain-containing protein n=1 Tax=Cellulomonas gilvus (strain ATCC 13127 / NRRL B-14078) TaxID=593907 RepID=F8A7G1_CELGA|nr:Domain of unknown function DUF1801 [Cellulomonas gilvus ATCC 13127]
MATSRQDEGFTTEERAAMKDRAREVRKARSRTAATDPLADLLAKIAELPDEDRALAEAIHAIVTERAPGLTPKTWYGMPAYARDGKVVVFFQPASKFKARYATLGFNDTAALDDGAMWPTAFALTTIGDDETRRITDLITRAAG